MMLADSNPLSEDNSTTDNYPFYNPFTIDDTNQDGDDESYRYDNQLPDYTEDVDEIRVIDFSSSARGGSGEIRRGEVLTQATATVVTVPIITTGTIIHPLPPPPITSDHKHIFLIRHAESYNNAMGQTLQQAIKKLTRLQSPIPSRQEWRSWSTVFRQGYSINSDLSPTGELMTKSLREQLQLKNFLQTYHIDLIVHSPMVRARRTCLEVFGITETENDAGNHQRTFPPVIEHESIYEKDISEHLGIEDISERTEDFTKWLLKRPEKNIVVVGHGTFLHTLIESSRRRGEINGEMQNCEVRGVMLSPEGEFHSVETLIHGGDALLPRSQEIETI